MLQAGEAFYSNSDGNLQPGSTIETAPVFQGTFCTS
jgi:hypothetical protein